MKKQTLLLLIIFFLAINVKKSKAQSTADVFSDNVPITYVGVDFTHAEMANHLTEMFSHH